MLSVDNLSDRAYKYIYEAISNNELPPGTLISEVAIADKLHISRSPIREALRQMESEGLTTRYPNRGTYVKELNKRDLDEIFELRLLFEISALESAIKYSQDEMIDTLIADFIRASETKDLNLAFETDVKTHSLIINSSLNSRLRNFTRILDVQVNVIKRISSKIPELYTISCKVHMDILEAIKQRDLDLAKERLSEHILEVRDRTIKALRNYEIQSKINI